MQQQKNVFLKGVIWRSGYIFSSFLLNVVLANTLGASSSGIFFYWINNLTIAVQLLSMGLDFSLSYFNAKKAYSGSDLFNVALKWTFLTTGIFAFLLYLGYALQLFNYENNLLFLILFVFCSIFNGLATALFVSSNEHIFPNLIPTLFNLLLISYLYFLIGSPQAEVLKDFLIAYILSSLFVCLLLFGFLIRKIKPTLKLSSTRISKDLLAYSIKIFLFNISISLLLRSDIWLIKYMSNSAELGNYIQTGKVTQLILLLPNLASFALLPFLTQHREHELYIKEGVIKLSRLYFLVSLAICGALSLTGYWLFPMFFGKSFDKMYLTFILLTPGIIFFSASYPVDSFFSSINKNTENIKAVLYALVIMLLLDFILIPSYSIYGAAIGSSIAYIFFFLHLYYRFKKNWSDKSISCKT